MNQHTNNPYYQNVLRVRADDANEISCDKYHLGMVIKLYIDYVSQPSRSVLALCIAAKIPYEVVEVAMMTGQVKSAEFAKINPMRKVPAIVDTDNNFTLAESHTILRYLCLKYNLPEEWYPQKDLLKQTRINQFLDFHHANTRKCSYLVFHTLFAPLVGFGDPTFNSQFTYKVVKATLRNFQKLYLKDLKFIGESQPCIADLIAFHDITMLELLDFDFKPYAKIQRWVADMRKYEYISKANQKFQESREGMKSLKPKL